ncbi:MAG: rhamnulokinase [Bacilli bacterium]|nr:rhamnulokinase [Bacilli bacterium]
MGKAYLAIDIGASSGRGILAYMEEGVLKMEEVHRFLNHPIEKDGGLIWDVDHLFNEIIAAMKACASFGRRIDVMGIDTWGVDYVLLDEKGNRLSDCHSYRDTSRHKVNEVHGKIPFEKLYKKTGIQFQGFNTVYQLQDDLEKGLLGKAHSLLMLPDYLNYLLTGRKEQEYTNATTTGMVNCLTHRWDEEILAKLGYNPSLFLPLSEPGTMVGRLKKEVEEEIGYQVEVAHVASHDTASAVLSIPLKKDEPYISSGTWSLLGLEVEKANSSEQARKYNYSNEGGLDYSFRFQKNIMGLWMIQEIRNELSPKPDFPAMVEMAKANPSKKRVDVNSSKFLSPKSMIGAIKEEVGEVPIGELIHIVYASLSESYARSLKEIEDITGKRFEKLHITGGGGKNAFLNELTAKAIARPVEVGPIEGTAIGNLLMQMLAAKEISSLKMGREIIKNSITIQEVQP